MSRGRIRSFRAMRWSLSLIVVMWVLSWLGWNLVLTSPASRQFGREVLDVYDRIYAIDAEGRAAVLEGEFEIAWVSGLPKALVGQRIQVRYQAPDRLVLSGVVDEARVSVGRNAEELWVHIPDKRFGVIGSPEAPRFTGQADSIEHVALPSMEIPLNRFQLWLLPALLRAERWDESPGGARVAPELKISPSWVAKWIFDVPSFVVGTTFEDEGESEGRAPKNVIWCMLPDGKRVTLKFDEPRIGLPDAGTRWEIPAASEDHVETVALSHLLRCARVVLEQMETRTPTLPAAEGRREVVGTSGKGRLEMHDGVRVLFVAGSPEEMGRQHGELLGEEIRHVADRIVYGVGVGSSFGKGQWVLGEIERAQARVEPFVPKGYLAEMDALADAAGLDRQEARLANFFPELFHCSGFALHGKATAGGAMYHGRILDYIRGAGLEDSAVVMICRPDGGNAWVNVSYAGFIGSVTAMNEKQLAIGEMGGRGEGNWDGKPMAQLVREVMERCDTIDEAVELMRAGPRTCEYYYVISDAKTMRAVGIKATPEIFETVWSGESHPQLPHAVEDAVLLSAGDRYEELVRRVRAGYGAFDADAARELMTRPVCMESNIQSVLFAPGTLDFWVANADAENVASHTRYTRFNLRELLRDKALTVR